MDLKELLEQVELRKNKQFNYLEFIEYTAKINILYLEGKVEADKAMEGISALISKLSQNLSKLKEGGRNE